MNKKRDFRDTLSESDKIWHVQKNVTKSEKVTAVVPCDHFIDYIDYSIAIIETA